jgi:hypothetical protein
MVRAFENTSRLDTALIAGEYRIFFFDLATHPDALLRLVPDRGRGGTRGTWMTFARSDWLASGGKAPRRCEERHETGDGITCSVPIPNDALREITRLFHDSKVFEVPTSTVPDSAEMACGAFAPHQVEIVVRLADDENNGRWYAPLSRLGPWPSRYRVEALRLVIQTLNEAYWGF